MSQEVWDNGGGFLYVAVMSLFLGWGVGGCLVQRLERSAAVEAGAAYYSVDDKTGEVKFQYGVRGSK